MSTPEGAPTDPQIRAGLSQADIEARKQLNEDPVLSRLPDGFSSHNMQPATGAERPERDISRINIKNIGKESLAGAELELPTYDPTADGRHAPAAKDRILPG